MRLGFQSRMPEERPLHRPPAATSPAAAPGVAWLEEVWRLMTLERALADGVRERNQSGEHLRLGTTPSGRGAEAIPAGICTALRRRQDGWEHPDYVANTLAGQHFIAMGLDPAGLMAESYGKATGINRGHAGHLRVALDHGIWGHQGVIGADFGAAVGLAWSARRRGTGQIAVCGFGDGASNQGRWHEAANLAAVHGLPVLFVCTNNAFATSVPVWVSTAPAGIARRAEAYGFPGRVVDGNDVFAVHEAAREAVEHVRGGRGPYLLECQTLRWGDPRHGHFRERLDLEWWQGRDPLRLFRERVVAEGWLDAARLDAMEADSQAEATRVFAFVDASPWPRPEELERDGPLVLPQAVRQQFAALEEPLAGRRLSFEDAIREALAGALASDPGVLLLGEDIRASLHNRTTLGLVDAFGPDRVLDMPISEGAFTGAAIALAATGFRPVVDLGLMSYVTVAIDETTSVMANLRYVSGGSVEVPLVVRTNLAGVGGPTFGATNTQSWHAWYLQVPNIRVAMPATAYDAKGLMATAIRDPNPWLFIEHRNLYRREGVVPEQGYLLPFDRARLHAVGDGPPDVAVVAFGIMLPLALEAAALLAGEGMVSLVVDPRMLKPFDFATVLDAVDRARGRLVVADNSYRTGGVGTWLLGEIAERAPGLLAMVRIVAAPDSTVPYSDALARQYFPDRDAILGAMREVSRGW